MSVEERHLITGTWFMICCDVCETVLSDHMNMPWGARSRDEAVRHISVAGWTDHGSNGEKVTCSSCQNPAGQEHVEDQDVVHTLDVSEAKESGMSSWVDGELIGFDLETTGVDPYVDVPVSFALVRYEHGEPDPEVWDGIINPGRPIPDTAIAVHGITNARAEAEGRDLAEAVGEITSFLFGAAKMGVPVVGMNISYDLKMIDALNRKLFGRSLSALGWNGPVLDILVIDRHVDGYRKGGRKLIDLCQHYGVSKADLHTASKDVEASVAVLLRQCERYPELGTTDLAKLYQQQKDWHQDWAESFSKYLISKGRNPLSEPEFSWPLDPDSELLGEEIL